MQARTSDEGYRGIPHGQAPFRDDHVVQDLDPQDPARLDKLSGDGQVFGAWLKPPGGVVVGHNDPGCPIGDGIGNTSRGWIWLESNRPAVTTRPWAR